MLDLVSFLSAPRLWLGCILGMAGGLGAAFLVHYALGYAAPTEMLALLVALGTVIGMILGGSNRKG